MASPFLGDALSIAPILSGVVEGDACTEQDNNNEQSDKNSEDVSIHHLPTSKNYPAGSVWLLHLT